MAKFYGWVPNTLGRLSFAFIGDTEYPKKVNCGHNFRSGGIFFAGHQSRDLSDTNLLFFGKNSRLKHFVDYHFLLKDGDFEFCTLMKKESPDKIKGQVFIFQRQEWKSVEKRFNAKLFKIPLEFNNQVVLEQWFGPEIFEVSKYAIDFTLSRTGEFECEIRKGADAFSAGDVRNQHIAASQAYFFIKDMFHKHRFHVPSSDTILDLSSEKGNWKNLVCYALSRKAIALRRQHTKMTLANASGVLSYLTAFMDNVLTSKEKKQAPNFNLEAFAVSIERGSQVEAVKPESILKKTILEGFNIGIYVIGAFLLLSRSAVSSKDAKDVGDAPFDSIANLISYPNLFFQLLCLIVLLKLVHFTVANRAPDDGDEFVTNVARYSLVLNRRGFPIVLALSSLIAIACGFKLLATANDYLLFIQ